MRAIPRGIPAAALVWSGRLLLSAAQLLAVQSSLVQYASADADQTRFEYSCEHTALQTAEPLSDIEQRAIDTDYIICKSFFNRRDPAVAEVVGKALNDFGKTARQKTIDAIGARFPAATAQFDAFIDEIGKNKHRSLPGFKSVLGELPGAKCRAYFAGASANVDKIVYDCNDKTACSGLHAGADATCGDAFGALADSINVYKESYTKFTAAETSQELDKMSADWDAFLAAARSQTLLDIAATTWFERGHLRKDHLVGPPDRTWTLLHPDVVYENLNTAPAGDRAKMGIAIEWFGVNFWRGDNALGVPIGVAVASVYADRPRVDAVGHGLMLHINNKYTLGWTHRDSGNGFYVTIDLLKAIQDNQQVLQQYKQRIFSR